MVRYALFLAAILAGLSCAQAQSPRIDRVDGIKAGIFSVDKVESVDDANISTGKRTTAKTHKVVRVTNNIPATNGTIFGVEFNLIGRPASASVPIKIIWRYPQPGIKSPDTGTTKFTDEYSETFTMGNGLSVFWTLGSEYTLVPGVWTVELWDGNRQLLAQEFNLRIP